MIRVVIFDAHGVILNGKRFSTIMEKKHHIPFVQTLHVLKAALEHIFSGHPDAASEVEKYVQKYGWQKRAEEFAKYWFATEQYIDKQFISYIMRLRESGVICCLATNQDAYKTVYMKEKMGLSLVFNKVFSASELGFRKPDSRFFHAVLESFPGISKDEVLYWDDTALTANAAKEFGFHAEVYTSFKEFTKKMQEYFPALAFDDDTKKEEKKRVEEEREEKLLKTLSNKIVP